MSPGKKRQFPFALSRRELEAREQDNLAPYAVKSALSRGRQHPEKDREGRLPFQLDRDRIVHSSAFRRLEYKTQVFVNHEGDHYRTRLTHTLEVTQISRSIARLLGLNEDLVEAIALSHDLGHAPFGHAGEDALNELMAGHGGFNHNRQSFRVIDDLELRYPGFRGLNLTWEVREAVLKHGWPKRGGVDESFEPAWAPPLEAQLADAVDAIAYNNHDIDDGLRSGYIQVSQLAELPLWQQASEQVAALYGTDLSTRLACARTISLLIHMEVDDLVTATTRALQAGNINSLKDVRSTAAPLVCFSRDFDALFRSVKEFLFEHLYRHYRAVRMSEKAHRFITAIFREYLRNPKQLPPEFYSRIPEEGAHRVICDYIAGMTDRYCQEEYVRIFHPFAKM